LPSKKNQGAKSSQAESSGHQFAVEGETLLERLRKESGRPKEEKKLTLQT